jgi:hypothetical protein
MAQETFQGRDVSALPFAWTRAGQRFWRCLIALFSDSKYSSTNLEASLKREFGESRTLSDWSVAKEKGLHVGMPITTAEETATFVAANYGGARDPDNVVGMSSSPPSAVHR